MLPRHGQHRSAVWTGCRRGGPARRQCHTVPVRSCGADAQLWSNVSRTAAESTRRRRCPDHRHGCPPGTGLAGNPVPRTTARSPASRVSAVQQLVRPLGSDRLILQRGSRNAGVRIFAWSPTSTSATSALPGELGTRKAVNCGNDLATALRPTAGTGTDDRFDGSRGWSGAAGDPAPLGREPALADEDAGRLCSSVDLGHSATPAGDRSAGCAWASHQSAHRAGWIG
jgi:hypothetical protein